MLLDRQRRLLAFVDALGGHVGALDFQKLLFLYAQEEATPTYEFVPYRFGAFSFTSYADKRKMVEQGFLEDEEKAWTLTATGRTVCRVALSIRAATERFTCRYQGLRGDALVAEAYRRYPYYAVRSEIAGDLLARDPLALAAIAAKTPTAPGSGLFTIGYEGRSLEAYLNALLRAGADILCDVRHNPLSRKYGFSKGVLGKACEGVGLRYEHLPELGIPYGHRVALTCFERLPEQCHRHCVAEAVCALGAYQWGVHHL